MLAFESAVNIDMTPIGAKMSALMHKSKPTLNPVSVRYTQADVLQAELLPEEVSAKMRQASFTAEDVEDWFEDVRLKARQVLADM